MITIPLLRVSVWTELPSKREDCPSSPDHSAELKCLFSFIRYSKTKSVTAWEGAK